MQRSSVNPFMRVLLVSHYSLPHIGGIEVLVDQLSRRLARRGCAVTVVSSRAGATADSTDDDDATDGVEVVRVGAWNILERWLHVPYPVFGPALIGVMRRAVSAADVVHVHGLLYLGSWCALVWAWWLDKPVVLTEHVGFVPYRSTVLNALQRAALALSTRVFLRRAEAVITLNQSVQRWLAALTPYPERLHFIPNGIDTERFRPPHANERLQARRRFGLDPLRPVALFVGRFVQKKGLDKLLAAAEGDFDLVLCGSGDLPPASLRPGVHVLREIDHAQMPSIYHAADVFVIPSHGEGFPVATMEAMASGLPVVAARDPAYAAYVSDVEMVQTDAEAMSLRKEIRALLTDANDRARRGGAARERAVADYTLDACVTRHLAVYAAAQQNHALSGALAPLGYDLASRLKLPELRALLESSPPRPWIDVGPGSGYATHHIFPPGAIIVVDVSQANLHALRTRARAADDPHRFLPVRADLAALPFRDRALGTVVCTEVLEHVEDDAAAAKELMRILAPAGRLIIEVPHLARGYASYLELLRVTTVHDVPGPEFHHRPGYRAESLSELFAPHGGSITQQRTFVGFIGLFLMDTVALLHLLYERLRYGRSAWTWADVANVTGSPVFTVYRAVFPFLRAMARLDALFSPGAGFILGARVERTSRVER